MGHAKLETTMIYTKLLAYPVEEEFICRAAETVKLASGKLIEAGFEYITNINSIRPFRKRKSFVKGSWSSEKGAVVQLGQRFAPGAREVLGSNPSGPICEPRGPIFAFSE